MIHIEKPRKAEPFGAKEGSMQEARRNVMMQTKILFFRGMKQKHSKEQVLLYTFSKNQNLY